ncbi:ABC-type sugar transport system substrate-binding protein [Bradyrhizobium sp. i1.3.1]
MDRRQTIKMLGGAAAIAGTGFPGFAFAQAQKEMVTVVKIAGIPWFNALEKGIQKGAKDFQHQCHHGWTGERRSGTTGKAAR